MKILVVDDEQDIRTLFEQRFRREIRSGQLDFSFAYSGEEALTYINGHFSEIVLILSDINMPGMSGIELLRRIRTMHPTAPPIDYDDHGLQRRRKLQPGKKVRGR
jgi:CheY-like chemotaxis protein